jgi:hypothetical protein
MDLLIARLASQFDPRISAVNPALNAAAKDRSLFRSRSSVPLLFLLGIMLEVVNWTTFDQIESYLSVKLEYHLRVIGSQSASMVNRL